MKKLIETTQMVDVVCDNPECDYDVPIGSNPMSYYLNKNCPKCGQPLLTIEDYVKWLQFRRTVNFINKWFSWITIFYSKKSLNSRELVSVHYHNNTTTISKIK